jgi:hypothetical protein
MAGKIQSPDESIVNWVSAELEARGAPKDKIYQLVTDSIGYEKYILWMKSSDFNIKKCYEMTCVPLLLLALPHDGK